ncbi:MAG: TonB family protein [Prevotella sp.]|nr:TonB family protein [Prevotella sp.]
MINFLIYDAKVAVLIIVFYMFYRLMLSRETFHRVNRVVLLLTALASFVLPLCVITLHKTVTLAVRPTVAVGSLQAEIAEEATPELWQAVLPYIFIIGVVLTLGHTVSSVMKVMLLIRRSERHPQPDGTIVCVTGNAEVSPFSWMHYIVMNRSDYEEHNAAILAHERGHIRLRHSWDLLLVDLLTALQWFNPAMWMLRQDLRAIHEYEADGEVLSQGINARQYQYLLISKASGIGGYSIANGISHSTLKNRITMMLHKKSERSSLLKLLALIPIVGLALTLNARTVTDYVNDEPQKQQPVKKGKKAGTIKVNGQDIKVVEQGDIVTMEGEVDQDLTPDIQEPKSVEIPNAMAVDAKEDAFDVVEEMPEFPGGPKALMDYLMENVKYPKTAFDADIQGRVIAQFVVDKEGTVRDAHVVKSVDPALDAEALRVINNMPKWKPGRQNGKVVNVKYTIPVNFQLQGDDKEESTEVRLMTSDGVRSTNPSGNIQIRYAGTTRDPLFIVDGVKTSAEKVKAMDAKTIDRMEVLNDKSAVEKYGDEAKGGVIVITTKK